MIFFIAGFLCALAFVLVTLECVKASRNFIKPAPATQNELTKQELDEIEEADKKASEQFNNMFSELNAFMTDKEVKDERK